MELLEFLHAVITARQGGWLCIASSLPDGTNWHQYWIAWPDDENTVVALVERLIAEGLNVYFSPHLFSEKNASKEYVIESRTLLVDLDEAPIRDIPLPPTILNKSSNERHQGFWILNEYIPLPDLEQLNKRLVIGIDNADHTVWSLGHMMRVPGSLNHKYTPPQRVRIVDVTGKEYYTGDFSGLPMLADSEPFAVTVDDEWIEQALKIPVGHANVFALWDSVKDKLAKDAQTCMEYEAPDRSKALWRLMKECFRNGVSRSETFLLAYHSKNNKFQFLRYNGVRELAKDVIRAEREVMRGPAGIRDRVNAARVRANMTTTQRRQAIADMCRNQLLTYGKFIHARGGTLWYILAKDGMPISISKNSTQLNVLLDDLFELNASEAEHQYVVANLINYTANLPAVGEITSLSYYLPEDNTLLLHTGKRDILRITPDEMDIVTNGYKDIIFLWNTDSYFKPDTDTEQPYDTEDTWYDRLFRQSMENLTEDSITVDQAVSLLRAWFAMLLMRNAMVSRPILAMFGQQGSGKTTMFRKLYALLYGPNRAVSQIGTQQDFDSSMAADPFLVLDNVDTAERWLPDRIARAAGISELTKRKLYTDNDTVTMRLQAFLGVTSINPRFAREDVLDRLVMFTLERIQNGRRDETSMIQEVLDNRSKYWSQIARDMQRVLQEPLAPAAQVAQFRVQDFSTFGQRVANALGFGPDFHSAIMTMVDQQKGFILSEDSVLVEAIDKYIHHDRFKSNEFRSPAKLWGIFEIVLGPTAGFSKQYTNSIRLGRKLWSMQDALKQRFIVEYKFDPQLRTRVWRFLERDGGNDDAT